ncbi:MAG: hypothetical protein ACJ73S_05395 [Mycobacteriales bacterium]
MSKVVPPGPRGGRRDGDARAPADRRRWLLPSGFRTLRDLMAYLLGAAMVVHEVFMARTMDYKVVAIGAGLMGIPLAIGRGGRS